MKKLQKIGQSKGSRRLCLWNRELNKCGLTSGTPVRVTVLPDSITIAACKDSSRKVSRVKNHGNILPVIDLKETKSLSLACLGEIGDTVLVEYSYTGVTLTPACNANKVAETVSFVGNKLQENIAREKREHAARMKAAYPNGLPSKEEIEAGRKWVESLCE
jgi:hypothetical protein|tara:strand:- start:9 stop:491 length:483 start_codon:yes stop_codon:yes gene_type:complete